MSNSAGLKPSKIDGTFPKTPTGMRRRRYDCMNRIRYNDMIDYWQSVERRLRAETPTPIPSMRSFSDNSDEEDWTKRIADTCLIENVLSIEEKTLESEEKEQIERIQELLDLLRTSEERFVQYGDRIEKALLRMTQLKIFQLTTTVNDKYSS